MGEAKGRKRFRQRFLREHAWCAFCGGQTPSSTIDHVPPINVFSQRRRPKGLEFPACNPCNQGSRLTDQVAGYLSRLFPDASAEAEKLELRSILRSVANNQPGLLEEMLPTREQILRFRDVSRKMPRETHPLNAGGLLVNRHMHRFAAKLGLALHYHHTRRIVPLGGTVSVMWMTNFQALDTGIPKEIAKLVGQGQTLRAGKFDVWNQFQHASAIPTEMHTSAHYATFRFSFAVLAFVSESGSTPNAAGHDQVFSPGFLCETA